MACERPLQPKCFLYLMLIILILPEFWATSTLPGCSDKCGDITIPYPFGINPGCYRDGFNITCDQSSGSPRALLVSEPENIIELIDINITSGEAPGYKSISYRCYNKSDGYNKSSDDNDIQVSTNLTDSPYLFSDKRNKFTVIGCDVWAFSLFMPDGKLSGCVSDCNQTRTTVDGGPCNGSGCCQTSIPAAVNLYGVFWASGNNYAWKSHPCVYAMLVEEEWYKFQVKDLDDNDFLQRNKKGVPVVLDWAIRDTGACQNGAERSSNRACLSRDSTCYNTTNGSGYLCNCPKGFEGNPYLPDGCIDIDECKLLHIYPCHGHCENIEGDYNCKCPKGKVGNTKT